MRAHTRGRLAAKGSRDCRGAWPGWRTILFPWCDVSVLTAHKILIASAVAMFLGYGIWECLRYPDPGGVGALVRGSLSAAAAVALGVYLRSLFRHGGWTEHLRGSSSLKR